jgi:hypothetical protein
LCADDCSGDILRSLLGKGLRVPGVLPAQTPGNSDLCVVSVLQVAADASAKAGLKIDVLLGALPEASQACVIPVVPSQRTQIVEAERISRCGG